MYHILKKNNSGWKATDGMCRFNQLSKRSRHAVTLRKAYKYKFCISLPHTHAHGSMYVAACLQLCLPLPLPPPHPNIQTPFFKSLVSVWVRVYIYVRVHISVTKGGLKAYICLHVSVYACVSVFVCHTHAHTIMVD